MTNEIEFIGHGGLLKFEVFGYENPSARDLSDANWLRCNVLARIGGFSGNISASVTTNDFTGFRDELRELLAKQSGVASFLTDEEQIRLKVEVGMTGVVRIEGNVQTYDIPQVALSFLFESDISFLPQVLNSLEKLSKEFPVKEQRQQ